MTIAGHVTQDVALGWFVMGLWPFAADGQIGQAFQSTTSSDGSRFEYATLGYPTDLKLGSSNDFSVSLWVNYSDQSEDLPLISNKDWDRSANQGWGLFTPSGGNFRVNVAGPNGDTDKFSIASTPVVSDGAWHHIMVSFLRSVPPQSGYVYSYVNGELVNKTARLGRAAWMDVPRTLGASSADVPMTDSTAYFRLGQ